MGHYRTSLSSSGQRPSKCSLRTLPNGPVTAKQKTPCPEKGTQRMEKARQQRRSGPPGQPLEGIPESGVVFVAHGWHQQQRTETVKMQPANAAEQPRTAKQKTPCPEKGTQRMEKAGQNSGQARPVSPLRASRRVASFSLLMGGTSSSRQRPSKCSLRTPPNSPEPPNKKRRVPKREHSVWKKPDRTAVRPARSAH